MSKTYHFSGILQSSGWLENAYVEVDGLGLIQHIGPSPSTHTQLVERCEGFALPGFQNAHSHAFQYAMAGLAEHLPPEANGDDFWSWREAMYNLALSVSPEQMEAIAAMVYGEMVRLGFTSVCEFHYLHHDQNGKPYKHLAEMGERLLSAAAQAGIKITLIPIFYQTGGFGTAATPKQRRFLSATPEDYLNLAADTEASAKRYPDAKVGRGIHSLRAVQGEYVQEIFNGLPLDCPFHIHVSEQRAEVEASLSFCGQRPVDWLLEHLPLNENCHLVHATHIDEGEMVGIAKSGAHVVLCPSTEGNLGDGIFPLASYWGNGGKWSIGTDSHIGLSPFEELRLLEYGQRLSLEKRNVLCRQGGEDSGALAYKAALLSGRKAMGNSEREFFSVGQAFDATVMDAQTPLLAARHPDRRLATMIYAADASWFLGTLVNGAWVVQNGRHSCRETLTRNFSSALRSTG